MIDGELIVKKIEELLEDAKTLKDIRRTLDLNFGPDGRALKWIGGKPVKIEDRSTATILLEVLELLTFNKRKKKKKKKDTDAE